jgi:hypothetical protein
MIMIQLEHVSHLVRPRPRALVGAGSSNSGLQLSRFPSLAPTRFWAAFGETLERQRVVLEQLAWRITEPFHGTTLNRHWSDAEQVGRRRYSLDVHVAAAVNHLGGVLGTKSLATTAAGYRRLLGWLYSFGPLHAVGVEGTGS